MYFFHHYKPPTGDGPSWLTFIGNTADGLEIKSIPHAPVSLPFIERLIGTVRQEYLDQMFFWGEADLELKLKAFAAYYNQHRVHYGISQGLTPLEKSLGQNLPSPIDLRKYTWQSHCRGLFKTPQAA